MLNTTENDGVNAVSQCPIAPYDEFTYKFKTWQYGTSWYHSHYSLQYGDGMLGPLTIHGPATASYDHAIDPVLMTDWNHRSAFMDFQVELEGTVPSMDSILLNGKGKVVIPSISLIEPLTTELQAVSQQLVTEVISIRRHLNTFVLLFSFWHHILNLKQGKKYLFRLINTAVDTTFIFAIDNHNLTVIASDFVPIHPYSTDHVVVGIGKKWQSHSRWATSLINSRTKISCHRWGKATSLWDKYTYYRPE